MRTIARAMLAQTHHLSNKKIVLASASPRRRELLQQIGLNFQVIVSGFEETLPKDGLSGAQYAELTATAKAVQVAEQAHDVDLVIGADTVVELNGQILEKPEDEDDACRMLQQLSGSQHRVHTGVALVLPKKGGRLVNFTTSTLVAFDNLSTQAIEAYVSSGEPMGKAGAYGIQGKAGVFVKRIDGCYFNVVGLPLNSLSNVIDDLIAEGAL